MFYIYRHYIIISAPSKHLLFITYNIVTRAPEGFAICQPTRLDSTQHTLSSVKARFTWKLLNYYFRLKNAKIAQKYPRWTEINFLGLAAMDGREWGAAECVYRLTSNRVPSDWFNAFAVEVEEKAKRKLNF